jgi:hypothetical protein
MTRYIVGARAKGEFRSDLRLVAHPPTFYQAHKIDGSEDGPERISWQGGYQFHQHRGVVKEWHDGHRPVIARVFPEDYATEYAEHDAAVAAAEALLKAARRERQEFLDTVATRAKPVRVEEARREREAWPTSPGGLAEAEAHKRELAKSQEHLTKLNDMMAGFVGGAVRR